MSTMNLDKPLDDIIDSKRKARRNTRNPRKGPKPATAAATNAPQAAQGGRKQQAQAQPTARAAAAAQTIPVGDKIVISNLPNDVNEQQVRELFTSTVGPVISAVLAHDSNGRSKGIATIHFRKAADATKAFQQYNKRLIDNQRPMKVEIIVDPSRVPPAPLTSRLGAAPNNGQTKPAQNNARNRVASSTVAAASGSSSTARQAGTGGRGRGRGRGRGGRQNRGEDRPKVTQESLDAEMSDYQAQANNPAA